MTQGGGGPLLACPACGTRRDRDTRFCTACGLDFWRAAAGGPITPVKLKGQRTPKPPRPPGSGGWFGLPFLRRSRQAEPEAIAPDVATEAGSESGPPPFSTAPRPFPPNAQPVPPPSILRAPPTPTPPTRVAQAEPTTAAPPSRPAPTRSAQAPAAPGRPPARRPGTARGIAVLGELVEGVPRRVLLPGGALAVLVVAALVFLLVNRPSSSTAVRQSASPTAPPPSHNAVINAFFREVRDPKATFAVLVKGTVEVARSGTRGVATIDGDFLVAGGDFSGSLSVAGTGVTPFRGSVVQIGPDGWGRLSTSSTWTHSGVPAQAESANPFQWISTVDEVQYFALGGDLAGQRTHRLVTTKWLSGTQYDQLMLNLINPQRDSRMEVVTTDQGVPLTATYTISLTGTLPGGAGSLSVNGTVDYTFSRWGEPITIQPPS